MKQASVRSGVVLGTLAAAAMATALGCGADHGSDGNNPFDPSKNPGAQGSNGTGGSSGTGSVSGTNYFPDEITPSNGTGGTTGDPKENACKFENYNLQRLPPQMMIVLDRSGSMHSNAAGEKNATPSRWTEATGALDEVLLQTQKTVQWGLQMYPTCKGEADTVCTPTPCTVEGPSLMPAFDMHQTLTSAMGPAAPLQDTGATPTARGIEVAVAAMKTIQSKNPKFLLLATDGEPNCRNFKGGTTGHGDSDVQGSIDAIKAAAAAGFPVFVVGFATNDTLVNTLNQMAVAGGRPRDDAKKYYPANSRAELVTAVTSIAGQVQNCTFQLSSVPPSINDVAVNIDGKRVSTDDWNYGPGNRSIIVQGEWCEKLKSGLAKSASIIFGCPGTPIP